MGRYQPFHDLPASQFAALVKDIEANGVLLPIWVDEHDKTIDGHQRRRAAAEAGVECPKVVIEGLDEDAKKRLALTLNLFRRQLSGVERSKALQELANLGLSTRRIADAVGVSKSTVHRDLAELSHAGQLEDRPERVEGADGKSRPASMPKRPPKNVDPETGEIAGEAPSGDTGVVETASVASSRDASPALTDLPMADRREAGPSDLPPVVGGVEGYRASATRARSTVRSHLLTLDPERVITTADEPDHWRQFSTDVRGWLDELDEHLSGPALKAVQ